MSVRGMLARMGLLERRKRFDPPADCRQCRRREDAAICLTCVASEARDLRQVLVSMSGPRRVISMAVEQPQEAEAK